MADKDSVQSVKKPVPYKYGEEIDFSSDKKCIFMCPECPECSEFYYFPSPEDSFCFCPSGHTWYWELVDGKFFMRKYEKR